MHGRLRLPTLLAALLLAAPGTASAATFTVNSTGDQPDFSGADAACSTAVNTCTLRAAIMQANSSAGADTVVAPAGTYVTGSTLSVTGASLTLSAPAGPRATILDGPDGGTALAFSGAAGAATVTGITITGSAMGVSIANAEVTLDEVAITGNTAAAPNLFGVGVNVAATGDLVLTRSAVTGNRGTASSAGNGAGIYVASGGSLTATTSTIAGNTMTNTAGSSFGGGIAGFGTIALRHVTLAGNAAVGTSGSYGGNIHTELPGTVTFTDSIVTGGQGNPANCGGSGTRTATGRSIDSGATCGFGAGHLSGTDPQLEPLGDHGGPTDSAPPAPGSPARDAAAACPDGGGDQRGNPAPAGPACDIGAAELAADLAVTAQAARTEVAPGGDVTYVVRVTNAGLDAAPGATLDLGVAGAASVPLVAVSQGTCPTAARCELGRVARGSTVTATIVARAGATGPIALTARAASGVPDPAADDDTATLSTTVAGPPATADTTAPALGPLKLSGRARSGRTVTLRATLSETATVTLKVERLAAGRRVGGRCTAKARRGTPCTVAKVLGTVRLTSVAGTPTLKLPARIAKRALAPGRHRITATATDAAGNRSKARTLVVTVRR